MRLNLIGNQLTGNIPGSIANAASLELLLLGGNQLDGVIPSTLGNLKVLSELWLNENKLNGPISPSLSGLTSLKVMALNGNQLSGAIPDSLSALSNTLERLLLENNKLIGCIPKGLEKFKSTILGGNQITGTCVSEVVSPSLAADCTRIFSIWTQAGGAKPIVTNCCDMKGVTCSTDHVTEMYAN